MDADGKRCCDRCAAPYVPGGISCWESELRMPSRRLRDDGVCRTVAPGDMRRTQELRRAHSVVSSMASSGSCDPEHLGAIYRMRLAPTPLATTASFAGDGPACGAAS